MTQLALCAPITASVHNTSWHKDHRQSAGTFYIPLQRLVLNDSPSLSSSSSPYAGTTPVHRRRLDVLTAATTRKQRGKRGLVTLATLGRVGYAGHVLIGTPPQRFPMLFDTGSDLALITSEDCQGDECPDLLHYSCKASSTCRVLGSLVNETHNNDGGSNSDSATVGGDDGKAGRSISLLPHNRANTGHSEAFLQVGHATPPSSDVQRFHVTPSSSESSSSKRNPSEHEVDPRPDKIDNHFDKRYSSSSAPGLSTFADVESGVHGIGPIKSSIPVAVKVHLDKDNRPEYYNQSFVDGSWGAGIFVQDRFQINSGVTFSSQGPFWSKDSDQGDSHERDGDRSTENDCETSVSSSSSVSPPDGHVALVTFLNVIQDKMELVRGYGGQIAGLLGLSRASPTGHKTFLQALIEQGALAKPIMSMHLEDYGGSFLLGGIDPQAYVGNMIYSPVTDPVAWQISLQGIGTIDTKTDSVSRESALHPTIIPQVDDIGDPNRVFMDAALVLDSGTSSTLVPQQASEQIHRHLGGYRDAFQKNLWILPCQGPDLVWWISDHGIIQPYDTLVYPLKDGRCQSLIFDSPYKEWLLGDNWLRGLYVVYDMADSGRIGIAVARGTIAQDSKDGNNNGGERQRAGIISRQDRTITQSENDAASKRKAKAIANIALALVWSVFVCYM